jgi:hypothetical protein
MVDFAEILDRCVADIQQGRATLASCQAQYPQYAGQLAALLPIADQLTAMPSASLSIEKRRDIQAQLLKRTAERQGERLRRRKPQPAQPVWRRLLSVAVVLMAILGLAGWGVTSASVASLPGDTLYPIKRFSERVTVALTPATGQPDLHVTIAQRRLDEYAGLAARGRFEPPLIVEAATEIGTALSQVESSNTAVPQASVEQVALLAETQLQALSERVAGLSVDQQQEVQSARTMFAASRTRMAELLKTHPVATPSGQLTPTATGTVSPNTPTGTVAGTPQSTGTDTASTVLPTGSVITPTSLVNTPKPKVTPPGLANTPKPKVTPPGQVKTAKPKDPPPAQEKPAKPSKK